MMRGAVAGALVFIGLFSAAAGRSPGIGDAECTDGISDTAAALMQRPVMRDQEKPARRARGDLGVEEPTRGSSRFNALAVPSGTCPLPQGARWCTAVSGDKQWEMAVYEDDFVSNAICNNHYWEFSTPEEMHVAPGASTLLDVGANLGWFSAMFAQHGFNVVAVEPMTSNRELLNATLCRNPELADRIEIKAVALTDVDVPGRTCPIYSNKANHGNGMLACDEVREASFQNDETIFRERVPLTTLNSVLASSSVQRVDVVKLDVEQHECLVLAGGQQLFTDYHPKQLALEVWPITVNCTIPVIKQFGEYKVHKLHFTGPIVRDEMFDNWNQVGEFRDLFLAME